MIEIEVCDDNANAFTRMIVGRTIIGIEREPSTSETYPMYANTTTLTLDDGATVSFDGWGYDVSGLEITYINNNSEGEVS